MTGPARPACVVSVLGNSVATMVVPPRASRLDGTYAEWLERLLPGHGIPADVDNRGGWLRLVTAAARDYEDAVRGRAPDVVVLHFGINEAVPAAIPAWLVRANHDWRLDAGPGWRAARRAFAKRLWHVLRAWQQRAARLLGTRTWRVSPDRVRAEVARVVAEAREDSAALVLVVGLTPPRGHLEEWIPGMARRCAVMQEALAAAVEGAASEDVRLVDVGAVAEALGHEDTTSDGVHLTPAAHRAVAEAIVAEVVAWRDRHGLRFGGAA